MKTIYEEVKARESSKSVGFILDGGSGGLRTKRPTLPDIGYKCVVKILVFIVGLYFVYV